MQTMEENECISLPSERDTEGCSSNASVGTKLISFATPNKRTQSIPTSSDIRFNQVHTERNILSHRAICDENSILSEPDEISSELFNTNNTNNHSSSVASSPFEIVEHYLPNNKIQNDLYRIQSPVNSEDNISCLTISDTTIKLGDHFTVADVKSYQAENNTSWRRRNDENIRSSTKEEKQRQNEEIVILESSSISSEAGSWEALFPANQNEIKESCKQFLIKERNYCDNFKNNVITSTVSTISATSCSSITPKTNTNSSSTSFTHEQLNETLSNVETTSAPSRIASACFIDASSLLDESEISNLGSEFDLKNCQNYTKNKSQTPEIAETHELMIHEPIILEKEVKNIKSATQKHVERLDSFHTVFEKCKPNMTSKSIENDSHMLIDLEQTETPQVYNGCKSKLDDAELKHRQSLEKLQGRYLFKNSIQQFSGHSIDPKMPFSDEICDFSLSSQHAIKNETDAVINEDITSDQDLITIFPDTPHNSITQIPKLNSSITNLKNENIYNKNIQKFIPKCDENCESLSKVIDDVKTNNFSPKLCDSPKLLRRNIDMCPIVSGGAVLYNFDNDIKPTQSNEQLVKSTNDKHSWVVDMSGCSKKSLNSRSSTLSSENNKSDSLKDLPSISGTSKAGSCGYFVDFDNIKETKPDDSDQNSKLGTPHKKSTGFFVDLKEHSDSDSAYSKTTNSEKSLQPSESEETQDKKTIFSMFIDFGDKKPVVRREPFSLTSKLSSSLNHKKMFNLKAEKDENELSKSYSEPSGYSSLTNTSSSLVNSLTKVEENQQLDIVERRPTISKLSKSDYKRHSWNASNSSSNYDSRSENNNSIINSCEYKRSASLSTDKNIMSILDKIPLISKTSSMSIDSSISPYEPFSCTKSDISNSTNSINEKEEHEEQKKRRRDVKINETFDKSSQGSVTDGIFSKDSSPVSVTETDELTFQNDDLKIKEDDTIKVKEKPVEVINVGHTMESLQATIEKQKQLLETVNEVAESQPITNNSFVKLSDLDKPVAKFELHSPSQSMTNSAGSRVAKLFHEQKIFNSKSIADKYPFWNMSQSTGNNLVNIATSVENSISLSRLFPHLSKVFSSSVPSGIGFNSFEKSSNEISEYLLSEVSYASSIASSRSGFESNDESSMSYRQPRRLGEDLLKMFLQEIATDVTIEIGGHKLRAHKCILQSRCQYFAALLAGSWVQNAGNIMQLPGYSYDVVHFALCHIYSGATHPPEGISLMELAALADFLGLEGLKEVTAHSLRTNYCHNFHKPCLGCIDGIVQVLPVSLNHGLDDLYRKCLKWVCRHYVKVWPTRYFAQLNYDILCRCKQEIIGHMNSENVLNIYMDSENLLLKISEYKWATNIEHVLKELIEISENYISDHFANLIASDSFLLLGHSNSWNIARLENLFLRTAITLTPDQACKSYQRCSRLNTVLANKIVMDPLLIESSIVQNSHQDGMDWNIEFVRFVGAILLAIEQCLTRQCARAMRTSAWQRLDVELRKKIQQRASLCGQPERKSRTTNKFNIHPSVPAYQNRTKDLHQIRLAIQAHNNRRSVSNDSKQYKATTYTQTHNYENVKLQNNIFTDKSVQANNEMNGNAKQLNIPVLKSSSKTSVNQVQNKPKNGFSNHKRSQSENIKVIKSSSTVTVTKLSNIKPRYLEPKKTNISRNNIKVPNNLNRLSSSDNTSRASSPASKKSVSNKKINESNISLDSLTSPARAAKLLQLKTDHCENSGDSLGESLKSSIKTEKTVSHESLLHGKNMKTKDVLKSNLFINKENKTQTQQNQNNKQPIKSNRHSTGPTSSISTADKNTKRSSLNSVYSSDMMVVPRKTFLSAKSREILARRANSQTKSAIPVTKSTSASPALSEKRIINKSSSSSCVPLRRQTTNSSNINKATTVKTKSSVSSSLKTSKDKIDCNLTRNQINDEENLKKLEAAENFTENSLSKLERSSTFCKEVSDIPSSKLQIIE